MIRKLFFLLLLASMGYFGYLVWNEMTPEERTLVGNKVSAATQTAGDWARNAARSFTETAREALE